MPHDHQGLHFLAHHRDGELHPHSGGLLERQSAGHLSDRAHHRQRLREVGSVRLVAGVAGGCELEDLVGRGEFFSVERKHQPQAGEDAEGA